MRITEMDEYLMSSRRRSRMIAGGSGGAPIKVCGVLRIVALPLLMTALFICLDVADAERRRSATTSKSVTALLDAKWSPTPILLEISEFLSEERKDYFWSFLDRITDLEPSFLRGGSDRDHYELVLREANTLISQDRTNFLKLALAMRSYSPTVEMFHQISLTKKLPPDCSAVIEVNNEFTCDISNLEQLLESSVQRNSSEMHTLDHHYPNFGGSESAEKIKVILYGELGTETFREFHFILKENAKQGYCDYIVRHYMKRRSPGKVRLSGYGVELAIKSTEYKAQDDAVVRDDAVVDERKANTSSDLVGEEIDEIDGFIISRLKKLHPDMSESLDQLRDHLLAGNQDLSPLKVWQLQDLGMQAAQRIASTSADEALGVMRDITQNFPLLSRLLIKTVVREELRQEILKNQNMFSQHLTLSSSDTALFVNGIFFDLDVSDIYSILEVLREEQRLMEQIHNLGVKNEQMEKILSLDLAISNHDYAVDIRDSAIMYLNNIEHDPQYSAWPSKMSDILRPTYPGVIRSIRKNIFHLVVIVDPSDIQCHDLLKLSESFYVHKAPIRVGLLLVVNRNLSVDGFADAGVAMLNALNFVVEERGTLYAGLSFLTDVYARVGDGNPVTPKDVITTFKLEFPNEDLEMIFGYESDYDTGRRLAWDFLERSGLKGLPEVLLNGVRLPKNQLNSDYFEEAVLTEVMQQTAFIQRAVYKGELSDTDDVLDFVMSREIVVPRLNDRILNSSWNLLDVVGVSAVGDVKAKFAHLSDSDMTATFTANLRYLVAKDDFAFRPVTVWVVTDLSAEVGRQLLLDGIEQMKTSNDIRLAFIDNSDSNSISNKISEAVNFAIESLPRKQSRLFVENILKEENVELIISNIKTPADFLKTESDKEDYKIWESSGGSGLREVHGVYSLKVLKFLPGQTGLVVNGRIIGPFSDGERFNADDFNLLERHSLKTFGDKIRKVFEDVIHEGEKDSISDLAFKVSAMLFSRKSTRTRHQLKWSGDEHSVVKITPRDPQRPAFNLTAIVDPVSRGAQKIAQILSVLRDVLNCHVWVFLNAQNKLSEMPLNSFYRYVLDSQLQFTDDDKFSSGPIARFQNIPVKPLFTLHMDTPDNWLVELVKTPFDLDNIRLDEVDGNVYGEFELEHLLVEGHCFDQENGMPPRGLQFNLGNVDNPEMFDTIVMSNLGYFQLKAHPGAWTLRLRNGRSSEIYSVVGQEGTDSPQDSPEVQILIGNFRSHIVKIKVLKYPGKKGTDLLADDDDNGDDQKGGLWNSITSSFGAGSSKKDAGRARGGDDSSDDVINIFSVASGHLYERLLRIMMLSVMKHTKTPVKFWFLKNYLSPTFKDFLPYMSKAYGFEYELVQYKWPRWLHQQTEKQRTIWGYKILFLDVLFPLSVKKIIFVDADQVVRADLKELRNFDLGGAPYGYTPFCESRREMDGYRFWKTGYWATHLQGRRYHISALYVVDLRRFRRIAAGDRLRGQYQGLSQDPNSLSNLDQDLPNNMIHQVAIKSLPQEWLWCETWCDDASKNAAKTIDLCNNPRTKEPKLSAAVRITPEWKGYDDEIKELLDRFNGFRAKGDGVVSDTKIPHRTDEDSRGDIHSEL